MNPLALASALLLTVTLAARSTASPIIEASPMPMDDPMPGPTVQLLLVAAGRAPYTKAPAALTAYTTAEVCPEDYEEGFSVRCKVDSDWFVVFRTDGIFSRREYRAPYYLNGDQDGKIFAFRGLEKAHAVRIACLARGEKAVWVDLVKKC